MNSVRFALAQINAVVGDLKGNSEKILSLISRAARSDVDVIIFPELAITGYPPEDLLLKPYFIEENLKYLNKIAKSVKDVIVIVGFVGKSRSSIYNSAAVINKGKIKYVYHKAHLPNYWVFDEKRYFTQGEKTAILKTRDFSFAVNICEDIWVPVDDREKAFLADSQFLINISASPYSLGKARERQIVLAKKAALFRAHVVYCNIVGGQDELIFDGRSSVFDKKGRRMAEAKAFEEDFLIVDLPVSEKKKNTLKVKKIPVDYALKKEKRDFSGTKIAKKLTRLEEVYSALLLGLRDYVRKNGFNKVALGLSGGIDSALVACIASDAVSPDNVVAVSMPSRYSSADTQRDAEVIAGNLGIEFKKVPIDDVFKAYIDTFKEHFRGVKPDITEENIQARIRGNILMAFSNKFEYLILNTGNKSETSVGYCTLYGDMAGGFSVIKDVPKRLVYELSGFVNTKAGKDLIPLSVLKRAPSAELRPGQKDQDSLPPYDVLDRIINLYIEKDIDFRGIVNKIGHEEIVKKVIRMIDMNEYKRRQSPPGIIITPKAFGKSRRMPITNRFRPFR